MKTPIKIGVSGDVGSFSEEAALTYAKAHHIEPVLKYLIDMEGVLTETENGTIDIGIFPVVNSRGGLVRMAYDAMGNHNFKVIDELWLEINQCLLANPDIRSHEIQHIVSHSQALAQCDQYLIKHFKNAKRIEWEDTAKAAKDLSQNKLPPMSAVIAPERSANLYGLQILAKNIQDAHPNVTTFLIVKNHGVL